MHEKDNFCDRERERRFSVLKFDDVHVLYRRSNLRPIVPMREFEADTYYQNHGLNPSDPLKTRNHLARMNSKLQSSRLSRKEPHQYIPHELIKTTNLFKRLILISLVALATSQSTSRAHDTQDLSQDASDSASSRTPAVADSSPQPSTLTTCFGGLQTFEKISMSSFESPNSNNANSFGSGILVQQDDQALTSECVNLCRSQSNCRSFVIDYNKFECKSYATTQQELQQEFDAKYQYARSENGSPSVNDNSSVTTEPNPYSSSSVHYQYLLPSASSNYFEKICLDGIANRNQFGDVCGQSRLWTIERVIDSFLDGYVEKEVTNVNSKDECSKLCIFENQFVCRSADYEPQSRLCRLSKEDRRTQPQAMRHAPGSGRQYLENQCATSGPSSCVYETKKNIGVISMDALKFAQTTQDCQMKCNQETTFNCRSYSFHQQRCFLSGDDSSSLNSNLIRLPTKQGWQFGEKKCLVELCTKGVFTYEKITGYTLRSALSMPIDLLMSGSSAVPALMSDTEEKEGLHQESSQTNTRHLMPSPRSRSNITSEMVSTMMMMAINEGSHLSMDPLHESGSSRHARRANNLAITNQCRSSCDLGYLNCPAFTIDYKNNRCQRLDRNSQGRHNELAARDGHAYFEKICLRVPEIMSMCQDKYWIFERVIGYELAPRLYDKTLKFVQSRRDCEEYCLEEKQFQCRSALYNDETSDCKLSQYDRRLAQQEGGYQRNFNTRISYLENQCIRDQASPRKQCYYEQAREEPSYPTFTEHIEMVHQVELKPSGSNIEAEHRANRTQDRHGVAFCEQLCNDNSKFECHSFGYYSSTAQCFLSGDDTTSAGESSTSLSTGFTYYEKKCRLVPDSGGSFSNDSYPSDHLRPMPKPNDITTPMSEIKTTNANPYLQGQTFKNITTPSHGVGSSYDGTIRPITDSTANAIKPITPMRPRPGTTTDPADLISDVNRYKCGPGHSFVYQRIPGFEPIGGYLALLVKNNETPGIISECSDLCRKAYECRAFVVDYKNNQCFAMLESSSVGLLNLRQILGKDYFEGFCLSDHILESGGHNCPSKSWVMDKIVDQAVVGVQPQRIIQDADRLQCRQACLEERLFTCKSALYDSATGDCRLFAIDRESVPQMRLLFTKGIDFYENQCQILSNVCPYDAIERDITMNTVTRALQAHSPIECEQACNAENGFNCRSFTYIDQYPSLPNPCLLSSDSRSTSQRGSIKDQPRALYAERNCYFRRPRVPGGQANRQNSPSYNSGPPSIPEPTTADPYSGSGRRVNNGMSSGGISDEGSLVGSASPPMSISINDQAGKNVDIPSSGIPGQACEPHHLTFERTFGHDYRLAQKERAPIAPSVGIAIGCQQECLRRGTRCQSFVVEYTLPYQSCFIIATQVGANKKLLTKSANSAYFEKVCLPRTGIDSEQLLGNSQPIMVDAQSVDIAPGYSSSDVWSAQVPQPSHLPYYMQQNKLIQNYPSRSCPKLWSFERFMNHNFTIDSDRVATNVLSKVQCETMCLNEASFTCRAATYDYNSKICRLFKNTRRTIMSQFIDLDADSSQSTQTGDEPKQPAQSNPDAERELIQGSASIPASSNSQTIVGNTIGVGTRIARETSDSGSSTNNIDYLENTCVPGPSSCQYRQLYDLFSPYIDKMNQAISLSDCQRQCDLERLFSCKSINYDPATKSCMLIDEDMISLNRGQQSALIPRKDVVYSEKGNCELISVQCNPQEMLVSINFDSPFRGRVMAKGNPEQCYMVGDGQTNIQFPIVFGPKCNSRQEGHNTFINEIVIQQHPVIMTDNDKAVRVMCAFEAPDQTITLKNPTSKDNKTGIDVGGPEVSRTRNDKLPFNSVVSNKSSPPSVVLRILDPSGRDATTINLGDDLMLSIQMQMDGQNSALGIFARNLAARSSNGETLLLIDNDGCPVDPMVFPALEVDPRDGKSLVSTFKAFRFPSSGLVNFEVQIRFCPEKCQPIECQKGKRTKSYGRRRRKRDVTNLPVEDTGEGGYGRTSIIKSVNGFANNPKNPLDELSTVMKPGKAFQYIRELLAVPGGSVDSTEGSLAPQSELSESPALDDSSRLSQPNEITARPNENVGLVDQTQTFSSNNAGNVGVDSGTNQFTPDNNGDNMQPPTSASPVATEIEASNEFVIGGIGATSTTSSNLPDNIASPPSVSQQPFQKAILMHVDERVLRNPVVDYTTPRTSMGSAPYNRFPYHHLEGLHQKRQTLAPAETLPTRDSTTSEETITNSDIRSSDQGASTEAPLPSSGAIESGPLVIDSAGVAAGESAKGELARDKRTKDMPLRFSILVGENQAPSSPGWTPSAITTPLIMNSSKVDPDHVVVPGHNGQLEISFSDRTRSSTKPPLMDHGSRFGLMDQLGGEPAQQPANSFNSRPNTFKTMTQPDESIKTSDQTFDQLNSNSVVNDMQQSQSEGGARMVVAGQLNGVSPGEPAAASNNDCQSEPGSSRLRAIIWTGTFVIVLNITLVIMSLILYFRKMHSRHGDHSIVGVSECGTQSSRGARGWPSVLLKSKNQLATSLNTHEQFFCKLNSKNGLETEATGTRGPIGGRNVGLSGLQIAGVNGIEFNWPNLSASSSHSTISSMASARPTITSISVNTPRTTVKSLFDQYHPSMRTGNFITTAPSTATLTGHKNTLDLNED